jgi:anaerobic sulfite reductase subunit B
LTTTLPEAPAAAPDMVPLPYRVIDRTAECRDTVTFTLEPAAEAVAAPLPGQFLMLWAPGLGEVPISIAGLPGADRVMHTVRAVGAATTALCEAEVGAVLGVRGPFGTTWPMARATGRDVVIVAGGIGLAPVRPVVRAILADRAAYGRVSLIVGARTAHDLLYRQALDAWWREETIDVRTTVDTPCSHWTTGSVGVVTSELRRVPIDGPSTVAMVCGPEVMMRIVGSALVDRGVPADRIAVSMERNMQCGVGRCGHCQLGPLLICRDGPVLPWSQVADLMGVPEL